MEVVVVVASQITRQIVEDANEFLLLAQDPETRAIWQAVRRGER